jgi:aryl-alcohol dehydrogenase-like predicted oxidoreductase
MNTRILGKTGRRVGEMGLGTWQLGAGWGTVSEADALATLRAAFDRGVTFFDTADIYGAGRSERLIGQFLHDTPAARGRLFVATKLGRSPDPGWPANFTRAAVRAHTEGSLQRLGVEALDLTQFHCVPLGVMQRGELFGWMDELQREGKIRAYGASVESMEEALWCCTQPGCASLQIIFNIFRQKPVHTLFAAARAADIALIVRLPLASGLLGGKLTRATPFAADDHRAFNRNGEQFNVGETFAGLPLERGLDLVERLRPLVPPGLTMAEWALRWCLDFEAVSVVIPGARNPAQAIGNARAAHLAPLGPETHVRLAALYEREIAAHIRGPY